MSALPEKIGKYEIRGVAGRGSMGVVYVGHDPFVDRKVAVKVCHETANDAELSPLARKMFFNEARAAGSLDHPNILKVYDAGEADGRPFMVMEFVDNADTLRSHCTRATLLPVERICELMRQAAEALHYAHSHGVLHRDIKPANLMLARGGSLKIVDFGIAQRIQADQTQVLGWFGSPQYMSPEQARDEQLTPQSDLFSLGAVMYELLCGQHAFVAKGISGLVSKILNEQPEPIEKLRPDVPPRVAHIVEKALAKDPRERFATGADMAAELAAALEEIRSPLAQLTPEQRLQTVRALAFFRDFSAAEVGEILKVGAWESYPAGSMIFTEGTDTRDLYVLVDGLVTVTRYGQEVAKVAKGECFGEMSFLTGARRSASVRALSPVTVLRILTNPRDWAPLPLQIRLGRALQAVLVDRLTQATDELARALADASVRPQRAGAAAVASAAQKPD